MSEHLSPYQKLKFQSTISLGSQSPVLKRDFKSEDKISLTIDIKYSFVRELYKAKCEFPELSYICILNSQLKPVYLKPCDRLDERLRRICSEVSSIYKRQVGGRQKVKLDEKMKKLAVYDSEIEIASKLYADVSKFEKDNVKLTEKYRLMLNELIETNKKFAEVEKELSENMTALAGVTKDKEALLDCLGVQTAEPVSYEHTGKNVEAMSRTQKYRITRTLKSKMEKALWFAASYGLRPTGVKLLNSDGDPVSVPLGNSVPSDDIERMNEILFILDKFKISDNAYHEIVMKTGDLPKLHSIVSIREKTNNTFAIHRTPGNTPGAYVSLKSELINIIKTRAFDQQDKIQIKISGDGTKVTRISNFIVISFAVLSSEKLSAEELVVLAIVRSSEKYENLEECLSPVLSEINEMYLCKNIQVDSKLYNLEIFFGGDMKFIQICLGLGSSTGQYACPWCKVHKQDRGDVSKPWNFYHLNENVRTTSEIKEIYMGTLKPNYGVKHLPLMTIEPVHIIPDELHLFMRIFDVLMRNLIDDVIEKDDKAKLKGENGGYLDSLVKSIRDCGVTFSLWTSQGRGDLEWTSLTGNDMKRVTQKLPDKLMFVVHNDTHDDTVKLWKMFWKIYTFVCSDEVERRTAEHIFSECKSFIKAFLKLGLTERKGYLSSNVTPYMHCLLYHVPFFISQFGSLRKFSGQPTEKINDNIKAVYHLKTNHHDCAVDAMKVQKRLELTVNSGRPKRKYRKTDDQFWENGKQEIQVRKRRQILQEMEKASTVHNKQKFPDFYKMTDIEIKQKLKDGGINTRVRKREKLIEMLKKVLLSD
ncbi:Hypothetical predicted protein [Mytilus galloprovincialis]|uniref:Uncharacterized protein n=1 Tax=Mytilus galloprovincialis TaxID=29158 RepID=A0A8B6D7B9_MYTGA|nr:Hypothetical predicted protein [Mytilus galloprovincialis]